MRFSTTETFQLHVAKRSGAVEPFSRQKVISGVRKACQGRPVSEDDLALLAQRVAVVRPDGRIEVAGVLESAKEGRIVRYRVRYAEIAAALRSLASALEGCCPDDEERPEGSCSC